MRIFFATKHYNNINQLTHNTNGNNNSNNSHYIGNRECLRLLLSHSIYHEEHDKEAMRNSTQGG